MQLLPNLEDGRDPPPLRPLLVQSGHAVRRNLMSACGGKAGGAGSGTPFQNGNARKTAGEKLDCNLVNELAGAGGLEPRNHGIKIQLMRARYQRAFQKIG